MKISARQYAQSLYELTQGKSGPDLKNLLANFVEMLAKHRELGRIEQILAAFSDIWDREEGELNAEMLSARSLDKDSLNMLSTYLQTRTGAKKIKLHEVNDKDLIGGFVLRYRDKILDASLKSSLSNLRSRLAS